jgi:predicted ATPase/DNA-binding SARP family transcriptional activator
MTATPGPYYRAVRLRVLGPVTVDAAGADGGGKTAAPSLGSRSQRLVLAVLAARLGETVSADVLIDALWGDSPPRTAAQTLRTYVSRLRGVLGDAVLIRPGGYALALSPLDVDAGRFEALVADAARARPESAAALLEEGLGLWRGGAFGDLADVEAVRGAARRLEELRLAAAEDHAAALLRDGQAARAAAAAEELVVAHPLREGAWALLVEALVAADRAAEALRAYQRAAAALADAGLVPSGRLREAERLALEGTAPAVLGPRPLPVPASSLVGRETDLEALDGMLGRVRMLTLCGPGGVGKTRLALALAHRIAGRHRLGARLLPLAAVEDPAAMPAAVADALGLSVEGGSPEDALARVGALDVLVVLDNCEHLIAEAARLADAILSGGRARIVATSRERLGIGGEYVWTVAPLAVIGDDPPARRLFVERAQAVRPGLDLGEGNLAVIDRIVRHLDGLPLAVEMAAATSAMLPLPELVGRLDDLDRLVPSRRSADARHRSLAAVVEWSEALLEDHERDLLADLSIFAGPVEESDVAAVTGRSSPLDVLCRLAERSLLVADTSAARARFGMLGTIRAHAGRRLAAAGRAETLARRHAEHVVDVAAAADRDLRTAAEADAAARLESLIDELRAAHRWARAADFPLAVRLSAALHLFAQSRLRDEPLGWAVSLVDDLDGEPGAALVLASAAQRAINAGDLLQAETFAERGAALAESAGEALYAWEVLADVHLYSGRLDRSAELARRMLAAAEESGDSHAVVAALANLSIAAAYAGRFDEAEAALRSPRTPPPAPSDAGWLAYLDGEVLLDRDPDRALSQLDRAVALADSVGNRYLGGVARVSACSLRARVGIPGEAVGAFAAVIEHWRQEGACTHQLTTLRNLVVLLVRMGWAREAAELLGAVEHDAVAPTFGVEADRLADARRWSVEALGEDEARSCFRAGAALTLDDAALRAVAWLSEDA